MKKEIQQKLKKGESIDNLCKEYNITFKDLFNMFHDMSPRGTKRKNRKTKTLYITKTATGRFVLAKTGTHYGTYRRLGDAKKVRDYFIYNGWDKRKIDEVCKKVGVRRCK